MANEKLISKTDLITAIRDDVHIRGVSFARVKKHIEDAPIVDAVEVAHGRWEYRMVDPEYRYYKHECSICGFDGEDFYRYCPNCGAKMDGDGNG